MANMELNRALDILQEYIRIDKLIEREIPFSDYDNFCEDRRVAIETVIKEIYKQDKQISEMLGGM